jgi:hypothetical protein
MAAKFIKAPGKGEDVRELYRTVAECVDALNSLMNMTVQLEGRLRMIGRLEVGGSSSLLKIEERKEVGSLGS